jgi:hypothetical protein
MDIERAGNKKSDRGPPVEDRYGRARDSSPTPIHTAHAALQIMNNFPSSTSSTSECSDDIPHTKQRPKPQMEDPLGLNIFGRGKRIRKARQTLVWDEDLCDM